MAVFKSPEAEGPGISKSGAERRGFFKFFELFKRYYGKLLSAGILKTLLDITVIFSGWGTVGASRVARICARDRHSMKGDFREAIRKNRAQALGMGIVNNILSAVLGVSVWFLLNENAIPEAVNPVSFFMLALSIAGFIFVTFLRYYTSAVLLTFNVTMGQLYKNSFFMCLGGFKRNFLVLLSHVAVLGLIAVPMLFDFHIGLGIAICLWLLIYPAFSLFTVQYNIFPVMMKFMIEPFMKSHPGEGENTLRELGLIESDEQALMQDEAQN